MRLFILNSARWLIWGISVNFPLQSVAAMLFEDNFDNQPNFTSTMYTTEKAQRREEGFILPEDWDALYQGTHWAPETGYPDKHASLEILDTNADKARGGVGKSAVNWRESFSLGWENWASDSQLIKVFDQQYDQLYVEFWVSFSDNFYARENSGDWSSKIFRVGSWSGEGDIFNGALGDIGPVFIWYHLRDDYGIRNSLSFRSGPWGENYYMDSSEPVFPRNMSRNYGSDTIGQEIGGEDPEVVDQINGGYLSNIGRYDWIDHEQLFGKGKHWTKVAFFVKLNSEPGAEDGVLRQWMNDERILNIENIPWVKESELGEMVGWNYIAIGGNDYFQPNPNSDLFEDWYAIDDLLVRDDVPPELGGVSEDEMSPPNPPGSLIISD